MANFGPVKTWGNEVLTPADLNAEILNIINNVTDGGINADNIDETDAYTWSGATTFTGTVTAGVDDTGVDVKFFGATTGKSWLWDESANKMIIAGDAAVTGATTLTGATQQTGALTVGVNDTGHDVKFFGATAGAHLLWDESADDLKLVGAAGLTVAGTAALNATTTTTVTAIGAVTVGVNDTGHDVKFFGATAGKSWLWDESADTEILTGNSTISGTLGVTGVLTATAQSVHTGGLVSGSNIVSDADSTDDLGTTSARWANLYVDSIGDTGQALAFTSGANNTTMTAAILALTGAQTVSSTLGVTGLVTATAGLTSGSNIVSDTDSTDDLGTTGVRWANLYVDAIVATDTIAATSYTGALLTAVTAVTQSDDNNSTKVATTAYVDSMVGGVSGFNVGATHTWTADQTFNDNVKVTLGTGGDADLYYDATNVVLNPKVVGSGVFNVLGSGGYGIARTDGTLHVHTATAGTVAPHADADDLVVEGSGDTGISILCPDASTGSLYFGSPTNNVNAEIRASYNAGGYFLSFGTNATEWGRFDQVGDFYVGDVANAKITQGITVNQGAGDGEILSLKSSDVAHGVTDSTETDTYATFSKHVAASGGLQITTLTESSIGLYPFSVATTEITTDTSASTGNIMLQASLKSGSAWTNHGATANIFVVRENQYARLLLKGNGDLHVTNTTLVALDGEDDIGLVRAFQRSASDGIGMAMTEWDNQVTANEEDLRRVGVLSSTSDFVIQQRMNSLLGGSVWQLHVAQKEMQKVYETEIAELKGQLNLLMERN